MNALEQDSSLLIGSAQDIESLARKDSAEIIVASDSHGGGAQLLGILTECGRQADAFIFCGDGMREQPCREGKKEIALFRHDHYNGTEEF